MTCNSSETLSQFRRFGYVSIPSLIPQSTARSFEVLTRPLPGRRVICGDANVSWEEQQIPEDHKLYGFFSSKSISNFVMTLLQTCRQSYHLTCWVSRYRRGEYISLHKDRAGSLQIVLSLNGTGGGDGGELMLLVTGETIRLQLNAGDAVVFRATSTAHYTTPVLPSAQCPDPIRVIGVGRYFFA